MDYDPRTIEETWQRRWAEEGWYEADPDPDAEATFVTVPYPYPSGGMHVGHVRTYSVPDVYARYRRLRGDNVLFPIAWHVTGTPIIGAVNRLKKRDPDQLRVLMETYGIPEADLSEMAEPMDYARYFIEHSYKRNMQALGLSVDWRREFTTNDERYSKFITWQYETLKEHGLLEKGLHPVKFCTEERNPVTTHDLLEGEEAEFQEYTLVKFREARSASERASGEGTEPGDGDAEGAIYPMATLRPETVRGVTNAFVKPEGEYVQATVDGETWVVSAEAAEKLELQAREVEIVDEFSGTDLVGGRVENPVTGDSILLLPATFVDPDNATGVVMSVPAHSPDDYLALREVQADAGRLADHGIDPAEVEAIEPVPILEIEGYGEIPARDAVERAGIDSADDPELHDVTADLYRDEFHAGRLLESYGEFAGGVVEAVREAFRDHHRETGAFDTMYEFSEEVVCRCGGDVEVAEQETWFLRYNDPEWKATTHEAIDGIDAIPETTRDQYHHTVDWLNEWPAIRNYGLGTRLPWDDEFVIEPLSDSTIYMAYYTIAPKLREVPADDLDREFFDALFFGEDAVNDPDPRAAELREEFEYWYPVDYRCSANDLISNHLTFYLFHHADLFEREQWPQGITIMGMGLLEGEKMSSSKGHVVLPENAIEEYGADTVRFFQLNSAEPWQDFDWRADDVAATRRQLERFWDQAQEVIATPDGDRDDLRDVDRWLLSRLQAAIRVATDALDRFETRTASQEVFFRFAEDLRWYRRRTDTDHRRTGSDEAETRAGLDRPGARWTLRETLATRLRLLAPFVPFLTNELHEQLTGEPVEAAAWPEPDPELESTRVEVEEALVVDLYDDVNEVVEVTETDPDTVRVYAAADWKRRVFADVVEVGSDVGAAMGKVMQREELRERGDEVNDLVQDLVEFVREHDDDELAELARVEEREVYERAADFLAREFDADVAVYAEDAEPVDPAGTAGRAVPFRPAIHIE